jgi:hypothetical protein
VQAPNTPNTKVIFNSPTRGDFEFADTEVPAKIPFGGEQQLVVHQLPGGARVVDSMGRSEMPLTWSGVFLGVDALGRARALDGMRAEGLALVLTWSEMAYSVVISSFHADFKQSFEIPYTITCTVIKDRTGSSTSSTDNIDDAMFGDMATANALGDVIGDSPLTSFLGTLDSAISSVSTFAQAAQSTINGVLAPIAAVTGRVQTLIASTGNTIANVATVGGILPSTPIAQAAASLNSQVAAMTQLPVLYQLQSVVGRMGANMVSASNNGQQLTTAGGSLYTLASQAYGDAAAWTGIARANKLTDPVLTGVNKLVIPALPDGLDGVFAP